MAFPVCSEKWPAISVIVLSFNRPTLLDRALTSIAAQTLPPLEIIIVDNKSEHSDDAARVSTRFENVLLIQNSQNLGYTGGMNAGIAAARGEYVYLTEDDMELRSDCLQQLVSFLIPRRGRILVAPAILNLQSRSVVSVGGKVELRGIFRKVDFGAGAADLSGFSAPLKVNYVSGAAMMCRAETFAQIGGFHPAFFLYGEDVELCQRLIRLGGEIYVDPTAVAFHETPRDGDSNAQVEFHKLKNLLALYLLHGKARFFPEFVLRYGILSSMRSLQSGSGKTRLLVRSWLWALRNSPALLKQRLRLNRNALPYRGT